MEGYSIIVNNKLIIAILIIISILLGKSYFELKEELKDIKLTGEVANYNLSSDSNKSILKKNASQFISPNSNNEKNTPVKLTEFLLNFYSEQRYDECLTTAVCSVGNSSFSTSLYDLDGDKINEYVVMPISVCSCSMRGASGNGEIIIVKEKNDGFELIGELSGNGYAFSKKKTNGYFDILTNFHSSASSGSETLYTLQKTANESLSDVVYKPSFTKYYDNNPTEN